MTDNQKTIFLRKVLSSDEILHLKMKYIALTLLFKMFFFILFLNVLLAIEVHSSGAVGL